jgi:membrane-bound lytic murein transglycosylase D
MIFKYALLAFIAVVVLTASDPFFGTEKLFQFVPKPQSDVEEVTWLSPEKVKPYLMDHGNRVSDLFKVTPYYFPNVYFWFLVYTQFDSNQIVVHDKKNLKLIYKVLDFTDLRQKELPLNTRYVLQQKISTEKLSDLRNDLVYLANNPYSLEPRAKAMYHIFKRAEVTLPVKKQDRIAFFTRLKEDIRTQTGQRNFIKDGMVRSLPYQGFLNAQLKGMGLPVEIKSIPFLESSFNPRAHSKVSAKGVWQFMPLIASYYVPKRTNDTDYRSNVGVSSVAASYLMSENFKILKKWDLAVTAYNSGTKHLLNSKRKLASVDTDLEDIIRHSDSNHFGFASKNFFSEFLALAHTIAYKEELFRDLHDHSRNDTEIDLKFYLLKCSQRLDKILSEKHLDDVVFHNDQVEQWNKPFSRGTILTAKSYLPKEKFFQIKPETLRKLKPKDWGSLLQNQSCSTR